MKGTYNKLLRSYPLSNPLGSLEILDMQKDVQSSLVKNTAEDKTIEEYQPVNSCWYHSIRPKESSLSS